jgi:inhibitor of cysteine peptidase
VSILKLNHEDNGSSVEARRGDVIIISLPETPSTGYRWVLDNLDEKILDFQKAEFHLAQNAGIGGGGIRNFTFQAIQSGTVNLSLKLLRKWLGEASIIERYHISIKIP